MEPQALANTPAPAGGLPTAFPYPTPTTSTPTPTPPLVKDPSYKAIKSRYFQSLNVGKTRTGRASSDADAMPAARKPVPTSTPISTFGHTRRRSNTSVMFAPLPPKEERKGAPPGDAYMQFAMSVPAQMLLGQSNAQSYMPSSSLDARLPRDASFDDLDEDVVYGRGRSQSFEVSQPIAIAAHNSRGESPALGVSNFVDRETDDAGEAQRRRAARIRAMVSAEAD